MRKNHSILNYILAPLLGLFASCNPQTQNEGNVVPKNQNIAEVSTLEEILKLEAKNGYDPIKDDDLSNLEKSAGLYNLNKGDIQNAQTIVIEYAKTGCAPCRSWTEEIKKKLKENGDKYDPKKVSFVIIKGTNKYNKENGISSFPTLQIIKKEVGKWKEMPVNWGIMGERISNSGRFFAHVNNAVYGEAIPEDVFTLSDDFGGYEEFYEKDGEDRPIAAQLAQSRGVECRKNDFGEICKYDFSDPEQLKAFLIISGELRYNEDKWKDATKDEFDDSYPYEVCNTINDKSGQEEKDFKLAQADFMIRKRENEKKYLAGKEKDWAAIFNSAENYTQSEFNGTIEEYQFAGEIPEKSRNLIREHLKNTKKGTFFYKPVIKDDIENLKTLEEMGAVILPYNVPISLLNEVVGNNGDRFIYQYFQGYDDFKEINGLMKFMNGKNSKFILLERGPTLRIPNKHNAHFTSSGNYFPENYEGIFYSTIWINEESDVHIMGVENLKDEVISYYANKNKNSGIGN